MLNARQNITYLYNKIIETKMATIVGFMMNYAKLVDKQLFDIDVFSLGKSRPINKVSKLRYLKQSQIWKSSSFSRHLAIKTWVQLFTGWSHE